MAREHDTIVAPATPVGRSALAIVRIDGPEAERIVSDLTAGVVLEERRATRVDLRDGEIPLDQAVAVRYASPRSFTGNDLVELTLHGSPGIIGHIVDAAISRGGRPAEPGEFTERAVLNGKLDLTQAEAIGELIESRTTFQASLSLRNLRGELSDVAIAVRNELLGLISRLEAALDFADEGYEFVTREAALERLRTVEDLVGRLSASYARGRATQEGLTAVLLGRPNAGKSTLLNYLCGSDRSIVTPEPGTTRDLVRETVAMGGLPVVIVDTAGLRNETGIVEAEGVRRARVAAEEADLLLYLVDASGGLVEEDHQELASLQGARIIYTKIDLAPAPDGSLGISVPASMGLERLLLELDEHIRERYAVPEGSPAIVNARQKRAIDMCLGGIQAAIEAVEADASEEIVVVDLHRAANALGELVGAITHEEVFAEIFSKFCIGK